MIDTVKIFGNIQLQNKAFPCFKGFALKIFLQSFDTTMCSIADSASIACADIPRFKDGIHHLIDCPLNNSVAERKCHDKTFLRVIDEEFYIFPCSVCTLQEFFSKLQYVVLQVKLKTHNFFSFPPSFTSHSESQHEIVETANFIKKVSVSFHKILGHRSQSYRPLLAALTPYCFLLPQIKSVVSRKYTPYNSCSERTP